MMSSYNSAFIGVTRSFLVPETAPNRTAFYSVLSFWYEVFLVPDSGACVMWRFVRVSGRIRHVIRYQISDCMSSYNSCNFNVPEFAPSSVADWMVTNVCLHLTSSVDKHSFWAFTDARYAGCSSSMFCPQWLREKTSSSELEHISMALKTTVKSRGQPGNGIKVLRFFQIFSDFFLTSHFRELTTNYK